MAPTVPTAVVDFQHNAFLTEIRNDWTSSNWPVACSNCKSNEDRGYTSRRQGANRWYMDHKLHNQTVELVRIDYWTGDLCNLACAICGPDNSSVWKQELGLPERKTIANKFWKDLDLSKLRHVHFNGGEPLLSKEHVEFLRAIPNKAQVQINYNTNGTVRPSADLLALWQEFELVLLDFSIDDVGNRFEYQRYHSVWDDVVDNLQWIITAAPHNCMFAVNTTVSILNQANLAELDAWLSTNFAVSRFRDPIEHRKQQVWGVLSTTGVAQDQAKYLDRLDQRRGTDWRTTFPELVSKLEHR